MGGEWSETTLGDLIDIKHGFAFKGQLIYDEPRGDLLLTPGNFAVRGGFKGDKFKYYDGPVSEEFVLRKGDLLVTMTDLSKQSDTLGYPAFVPAYSDGRRCLHNQRLGKVTPKETADIDLRYIYYVMCGKEYRQEVLASATGTTVKHTSPERLRRFRFLIPPLPEQRAIAHILGTLDDKIELKRRMNETLEAMARALFKDWFVDFGPTRAKIEGRDPYLAPEIWDLFPDKLDEDGKPEGWETQSVIDQAEWVNGAAYGNMHFSNAHDALPVVKIAELKAGVTKNTKRTNTELGDKYRIRDRELLFSWSGNPDTSIDTFIWTGGEAWLNQHIFAVRDNGARTPAFLYTMLKWLKPEFAEIARNKQTTGLGHVTKQDLKRMQIYVGPRELLEESEHLIGPLHARMQTNLVENMTLAQARDLLLPNLVSGEIRVGDIDKIVKELT